MLLDLSIETPGAPENLQALLTQVADACFDIEGISDIHVSGRIVDDDTIRQLNRDYRGIDRSTDVLSFPSVAYKAGHTARNSPKRLQREYDPETGLRHLGDFAISLPHAVAQAEEYGHSLLREIGYLTAHSMFHLMGYDHMVEEEKKQMRALEEQAMEKVSLQRNNTDEVTPSPVSDQELFHLACEALKRAYAPYSNFYVGASVLTDDGQIFTGCNIENGSYGATVCAERCAMFTAVAAGHKKFVALAVAGGKTKAWPCGICRQVMAEFGGPSLKVIVGNAEDGTYEVTDLNTLLPNSYVLDGLL